MAVPPGRDRTWTPLDHGAPDWAMPSTTMRTRPDGQTTPLWRPGTVTTVPGPRTDEAAYDVLADREAASTTAYEDDPRAYGEALEAAVPARPPAVPRVPVEVTIDTDERTWRDDSPSGGGARKRYSSTPPPSETPLPWSGIAPGDYPPGQSVADAERAAGRLPHLRLDEAADRREADQ